MNEITLSFNSKMYTEIRMTFIDNRINNDVMRKAFNRNEITNIYWITLRDRINGR